MRGLAATAALCLASACARGNSGPAAVATQTPGGDGRVGFVRMDALIKVHPLYGELSQLDQDVAALQLKSVGPEIGNAAADLPREERALQVELDRAAAQTRKALDVERREYAVRERATIDAALRNAGVGGPSGASIASDVATEARAQSQRATASARQNFAAYRQQLIDQDKLAVATLERTYDERAVRAYRARADRLQRKEADYALQLANDDAAERLSLRTRLSNLALDDTSRADVKGRLDALDRKEADAVAAMKNRDETELLAYRKSLHDGIGRELSVQVGALQKRTIAKIDARALQTRTSLTSELTALPGTGGAGPVPANVPPQMRAKLLALHEQFQASFDRDANRTLQRFQQTRVDLTTRFRQLAGIDGRAQAGAGKQIAQLQKQRGDLYGEMVAQIDREVRAVAQKRGVGVVVREVMAPAGGVDLTDDAEKDIESLHE